MRYLTCQTYTKGECICDYSLTYQIRLASLEYKDVRRYYRMCSEDFEMRSLYDVYANPSPTKVQIWDEIREIARCFMGTAFILTHNVFFFTAYIDCDEHYIAFTPSDTFAIPKQ